MQIHDSIHTSILSSDSGNIPFRGLVHLLVLILMTYTVRAIIDSLEKHDFVLIKEVSCLTLTTKSYRSKILSTVVLFKILPTIKHWQVSL